MVTAFLIVGLACLIVIPAGAVILFMLGLAGVCNMLARGEYGDDGSNSG